MIFNNIKNAVKSFVAPKEGKDFHVEVIDRKTSDISASLTPSRVTEILTKANSGNSAEQARLAREICEKNWDISHSIDTRINAINACNWKIKSSDAKFDVSEIESQLNKANINDAIRSLSFAFLTGYAGVEIIWGEGGKVVGFNSIEQEFFDFQEDFSPRIVLKSGEKMELPINKVIFHIASRSKDICRGGLIRPLAWLHCFSNMNTKDFLSYTERFGMPLLVIKADESLLNTSKSELKRMIRDFNSSGGAIFSPNVDYKIENSGSGNGTFYIDTLKFWGEVITKVVLGQTATAGDGGGWSNDSAQSRVRQDILDADCRALEATISQQLLKPLQSFLYPTFEGVLLFEIESTPPENVNAQYEAKKNKYDAMGVAIRAGILTASSDIEAYIREDLGLPAMGSDVSANWGNTKGVRRPITLAAPVSEEAQNGLPPEMQLSEKSPQNPTADKMLEKMVNTGALEAMFGKSYDAIEDIANCTEEDFDEKLKRLVENPPKGDTRPFEEALEESIYDTLNEKRGIK